MKAAPIVFKAVPQYVQGPDLLDEVGSYVADFARDREICVLLDSGVGGLRDRIGSSLAGSGLRYFVTPFDGDVRREQAEALAAELRGAHPSSVVMGVGGGKAVDMSKMLARRLGALNVVIPTSSATDAPPSHSAVALDQQGHISAESMPESPRLVLVDSRIIASAPPRLFAAGIGDAVSKSYEMETAVALGEANFVGGSQPFFVAAMAGALHSLLLSKGGAAVRAVRSSLCTAEVEEVITACILLSTLVWENGGLAGAHSVANVFFNSGYCARALHGEQVAVALLLHLWLQEKGGEVETLRRFYAEVGLPRRPSDLGISGEDRVAETAAAVHARWKKHRLDFPVPRIIEAFHGVEGLPDPQSA